MPINRSAILCFRMLLFFCLPATAYAQSEPLTFIDATNMAGLGGIQHLLEQRFATTTEQTSGGIAVEDVNLDGYADFFVITGERSGGELWLNQQDGTFKQANHNGHIEAPDAATGPLFFYYNNDPLPDLFIGSASGAIPVLYLNMGDGNFSLAENTGLELYEGLSTTGATAIDFDRDGWEDLFLCHWNEPFTPFHFFRNQQGNGFTPYDTKLNFYNLFAPELDHGFTANFRDLNQNGFPDLLLSGDFGTTQLWINEGGQQFVPTDPAVFTDQNGMGAAVGDYDNDGDEDWFVTAIFDGDGVLEGNWGGSGNRLYRNEGKGKFMETPPHPSITQTGWGWAASFADFNHDGWLDLMVTNGWPRGEDSFKGDTSRLLINNHSGQFLPLPNFPPDTFQGRGIGILDVELDGDLDILIANNNGPLRLYKNQLNDDNWLRILPLQAGRTAHGALVILYTTSGVFQRQVGESSNYVSQNETVAHFGLPQATNIDSLIIQWPDGASSTYYQIETRTTNLLTQKKGQEYSTPPDFQVFPNPVRAGSLLHIQSDVFINDNIFIWSSSGQFIGSAMVIQRDNRLLTLQLPPAASLPLGEYYITFVLPERDNPFPPIKIIIE